MQKTDSEFLIWLAKRLVYKYKENTDIIGLVENITQKYGSNESSYDDLLVGMHSDLSRVISDLSNINMSFMDKINTIKHNNEKLQLSQIDSIFEYINFDKLTPQK